RARGRRSGQPTLLSREIFINNLQATEDGWYSSNGSVKPDPRVSRCPIRSTVSPLTKVRTGAGSKVVRVRLAAGRCTQCPPDVWVDALGQEVDATIAKASVHAGGVRARSQAPDA